MYHIFKITNLINNKFYIYYSRRDIMKFRCPGVSGDIRNIGLDNFKFERLSEHPTKKSATGAFAKIDVPSLILLYPSYNKNKSSKGMLNVCDKDGNKLRISNKDPRFLSGELTSITKGMTVVQDKDGNNFSVSVNDERFINGELISIHKNKVLAKDDEGNKYYINVNDERYLSGTLKHIASDYKHNSEAKEKMKTHYMLNRNKKYKNFNYNIEHYSVSDKRFILVKNFCKHGDLQITTCIFKHTYESLDDEKYYCERCKQETLDNFEPTEQDHMKYCKIYNEYLNVATSSKFRTEIYIKLYYPKLHKRILLFTSHYENIKWQEQCYMFIHHMKNRPLCEYENCKENVTYNFSHKKHTHYCDIHKEVCNTSIPERQIRKFVINLIGEDKVIVNSKKIIYKELDIFVPSLNLAIEHNGIYYHDESHSLTNSHYDKWNRCNNKNIKLIT